MLTGFNTDIEHDGVVYHVQTEDKGLSTPLILSLVYSGGAILASKRSPYQDLIDSGFNEDVLAERLKRQHRLICAAIAAGRVEDLKQMGARDAVERKQTASLPDLPVAIQATPAVEGEPQAEKLETRSPEVEAIPVPPPPLVPEPQVAPSEPKEVWEDEYFEVLAARAEEEKLQIVSNADDEPLPVTPEPEKIEAPPPPPKRTTVVSAKRGSKAAKKASPPPPPPPPIEEPAVESEPTPYVVFDSRRSSTVEVEEPETGLRVRLMNEHEFHSGESLNLEVRVTNKTDREEIPVSGASVSFKVLGTTFRPVIVTLKTGKDGTARIKTEIPKFNSGRAAILVRAAKGPDSVEIRRVVYPG